MINFKANICLPPGFVPPEESKKLARTLLVGELAGLLALHPSAARPPLCPPLCLPICLPAASRCLPLSSPSPPPCLPLPFPLGSLQSILRGSSETPTLAKPGK